MAYKYEDLINGVVEAVGGIDNINYAAHCATRLRLGLGDMSKMDDHQLKEIDGVLGIQVKGNNQVQVFLGTVVSTVYDEFMRITGFNGKVGGAIDDPVTAAQDAADVHFSWKRAGSAIVEYLGGTVAPVIPIYLGCGMLMAFLNLCTSFFGLGTDSGTYTILMGAANAGFYFMPIALGWSACQKLGANPALGALLGMTLLYTSINNVANLDFLGIPVYQTSYNGTFLPMILGAAFLSVVYKFFRDKIPQSLRYFALPLICMLISIPVTLIVLGPIGYVFGTHLQTVFNWLNENAHLLAITIWSFTTPFGVITGIEKGVVAVNMSNMNAIGYDSLFLPGDLAGNAAIGGAALAVWYLSRNTRVKSLGASAGITAIVGITEPSLYGLCIPYQTPLLGACCGAAVGGLFAGLVSLKQYVYAGPGLATCIVYLSNEPGGMFNFLMCFATIAVSVIAGFAITVLLSRRRKTAYGEPDNAENAEMQARIA